TELHADSGNPSLIRYTRQFPALWARPVAGNATNAAPVRRNNPAGVINRSRFARARIITVGPAARNQKLKVCPEKHTQLFHDWSRSRIEWIGILIQSGRCCNS